MNLCIKIRPDHLSFKSDLIRPVNQINPLQPDPFQLKSDESTQSVNPTPQI